MLEKSYLVEQFGSRISSLMGRHSCVSSLLVSRTTTTGCHFHQQKLKISTHWYVPIYNCPWYDDGCGSFTTSYTSWVRGARTPLKDVRNPPFMSLSPYPPMCHPLFNFFSVLCAKDLPTWSYGSRTVRGGTNHGQTVGFGQTTKPKNAISTYVKPSQISDSNQSY